MPDAVEGRVAPVAGVAAWFNPIARACEIVATGALALMVAIIVVDVVTRNFLGFSLQVSDELCGYLLVAATFLAMPVALAHGAFHRVRFVEDRLPEQTRRALQLGVTILSLAVCLIIEWPLIRVAFLSYRAGNVAMTDLGTPIWIPQTAMPIGFGLLCLGLMATIIWQIVNFRRPAATPGTGK